MKVRILITLGLIFLLGGLTGMILSDNMPVYTPSSIPQIQGFAALEQAQLIILQESASPSEQNPKDRVPENDIHVYNDKIVLDIPNAQWATFTDTKSMEPVLFTGANVIKVMPKKPEEIKVGDIISYHSEYVTGTIIHRVAEIGYDKYGWFARAKPDNENLYPDTYPKNANLLDPGKIRFNKIVGVTVAIIY